MGDREERSRNVASLRQAYGEIIGSEELGSPSTPEFVRAHVAPAFISYKRLPRWHRGPTRDKEASRMTRKLISMLGKEGWGVRSHLLKLVLVLGVAVAFQGGVLAAPAFASTGNGCGGRQQDIH